MAAGQLNGWLAKSLRALVAPEGGTLSDGQLLDEFLAHQEDAAFEAIVRRHGPMVLGVCRRVLRNPHDADDAFQATFLVLVRRAATLRLRIGLANWLYGVAYHTALKTQALVRKRQAKEAAARAMSKATLPPASATMHPDWEVFLDEELNRLPESLRSALVLCDLEGKTRQEAARQLGVPAGTLSGRLTTARRTLASRLAKRGVTLSAGGLAALLTKEACAAVPRGLTAAAVESAKSVALGLAPSLVSGNILAITEGVVKTMFLAKLKTALVVLAALGVLGIGARLCFGDIRAEQPGAPMVAGAPRAQTDAETGAGPAAGKSRKATGTATKARSADDEPINHIWITDKRVQEELRLSEEQVKQIAAVRLEVSRQHAAELKEQREAAEKRDFEKAHTLQMKFQDAERKAFAEAAPRLVSESALARLRQIQRQARGLHNLVRDRAVQNKLKLTDEQIRQIEGYLKEGLEEARKDAAKRTAGGAVFAQLLTDAIAFQRDAYSGAMAKVVGVFTESQRRTWNEYVGEPFEFREAK
jgi:RNA polymerase sigma factor (sigma-70 family)